MIPLSEPCLRGNEWKYVKECLDTNWVSSVGAFVNRFEKQVAAYVGAKHAVAVVNGTAALHVALLAAGVEPDDEVLVSTLTFIAPVNAIRYVGAVPVFMDADPHYWQMDVDKTLRFLKKECRWRTNKLYNKKSGRRVKAILPVHLMGHPVDLDPLLEAARRFGLVVIEDSTESLGAEYKNRKVGHLGGDISCLSFNGNKIITTGGGGMILTDEERFAEKTRYLSTQAKDDPIEYVHNDIGYNYRLTNLQAAMGVAQMEQLDTFVASKRATAAWYARRLSNCPGASTPLEASWAKSTYWLYTLMIDRSRFGLDSRSLMRKLAGCKIQARPFWKPAHLQTMYRRYEAYQIEHAEELYARGLSIPCSIGLSLEARERVGDEIMAAAHSADAAKAISHG